MAKTIVLDDLDFSECPSLGAFKVRLFEDGEQVATVILTQAVLQIAVHRAMNAIEARQGREANVIAFPLHHADTA